MDKGCRPCCCAGYRWCFRRRDCVFMRAPPADTVRSCPGWVVPEQGSRPDAFSDAFIVSAVPFARWAYRESVHLSFRSIPAMCVMLRYWGNDNGTRCCWRRMGPLSQKQEQAFTPQLIGAMCLPYVQGSGRTALVRRASDGSEGRPHVTLPSTTARCLERRGICTVCLLAASGRCAA